MYNCENPLFVTLSITGIAIILTAIIMTIFPPKKINSFYGFRTNRSMKNQENWDFAQQHFSRQLIFAGLITIFVSFTGLLLNSTATYWMIIALIILVLILLFFTLKTENALKAFEHKKS